MKDAFETEEYTKFAEDNLVNIGEEFLDADEFEKKLKEEYKNFDEISKKLGLK